MIGELNGDFLQWLRGFYYVAKTGSVRKAAEIMLRNPSTISYQLHSLEESLGTVLFHRHKKSLKITPEGETLLGWTISTFETLQNLMSSVGSANGELQGKIQIAATLPIASLVVRVISEFIKEHPKVEITLERYLSGEVRKAVEESRVDFGLLPVIARPEKDHLEVLAKARPLLVLHKDNPWKVPPIPDLNDLRKLPYVAFSDRDCPDDLGNYILEAGMGDFIHKNAIVRVNNYHLILRFVWNRVGVCIIDNMCYQASNFGADWQQLMAIPLDHLFPNRLYGLLQRRQKYFSPQASALMNVLRKFFDSHITLESAGGWAPMRHQEAEVKKGRGSLKSGLKKSPPARGVDSGDGQEVRGDF